MYLSDSNRRVVIGHHGSSDVVVLHDVDSSSSCNREEAQQLTRHSREHEELFGVQEVRVAAKCSIGGEC